MSIKLVLFLALISGLLIQDKEIVWTKDANLIWADFQGKPQMNSPAAAVTAAGITYNYSISQTNNRITGFDATVLSHFYPEHSWFKKDQITDHILGHEQFHFNITELHSRLLRKALSKLKPSQDLESRIKKLYRKTNKDLDAMQRAYDKETNYSTNHEAQREWEKKVQLHINLLEAYQL